MPDDLTLLRDAAHRAAAIARRYFRRDPRVWHKHGDAGPVTEADLEIDTMLRETLTAARPAYGWLSEETADDGARLAHDRVFIVDPIDGTRAFLRGDDQFTVCLAICEAGEVLASVIYAPARDEVFAAAKGKGATLNGRPIRASSGTELHGCRMIGAPKMFEHPAWPETWPPMAVTYQNSTSYRMASVAAGRFDATIALSPKADWDTAPGALIAREAGAEVSDHLGRPFTFDRPRPEQPGLVCAAPGLYPQLRGRLAHLPDNLRSIRR